MPFSFPASPSVGQQSTQNGRAYTWSGYAWEISVTSASIDATLLTGTIAAARLPLATTIAAGAIIVGTGLGVSSGTVSVTYGTTSGTSCQGNDSRLSDTRTPTDGSVTTAKIANSAVTYAKIQNVSATDRLLGRSSAGAGVVEEITCTSFGRSLIDDADAATARSTLSVQPTASPAFTGAATFDNTGNVVPLTVTNTGTANSFVVNDESGDTSPFVIDASGNVGVGATPTALFHTTKTTSGNATDAIWRHTYNNDWGVTFQQQHVLNSHIQWNWVDNAGNTLLCWKQGNVGIGTSSPTISSGVGLHIADSTLRLGTARTPASASATGNTGEICWDASYLYICTATNTWRRIAHSTW